MGRHLCTHVDRDAADLVVPHVAFTGVQANSDVDAKTRRGGADGARAPDRAGGSVECADETAGQRLEAPASEPLELLAGVGVEAIEARGRRGATVRVVLEQGNAGAH